MTSRWGAAMATLGCLLPENAELSVSEEVTGGWRRVRLANGGIAFMRDDELRLETATPSCMKTMNRRMFLAAMGTGLLAFGVGAWLWPSRNDLLDVINHWNGRHVDHPITIDHGLIIRN